MHRSTVALLLAGLCLNAAGAEEGAARAAQGIVSRLDHIKRRFVLAGQMAPDAAGRGR